jgi:hypothetical protein
MLASEKCTEGGGEGIMTLCCSFKESDYEKPSTSNNKGDSEKVVNLGIILRQ